MSFFTQPPLLTDENDNKVHLDIVRFSNLIPQLPYDLYKIQRNFEFRPDKIAFEQYDDADLSWIIDIANNFEHGFKEYTYNRIIKIPRENELINRRIISI